MQVITSMDELERKVAECNDALTHQSDDAMRRLFGSFRLDLSATLPPDPFSPEYRAFQFDLYRRVAGKEYGLNNERTLFDVASYQDRPFPFYPGSTATAGNHLLAIGFLLRCLHLPPGARIVEFGPGWGNTTLALALLGFRVTAVDVEPNFCAILRHRARQHGVEIDVVQADFFWAEQVDDPFDAALFFECFHHCDDHMRLLRALKSAVKPGGLVAVAAEPIIAGYGIPWGLRTDGEALWAIRNFGWLELGFRQSYFEAALARTGWTGEKHPCPDPDWAGVWLLRHGETRPGTPMTDPPPPPPPRPTPEEELRAVYASTSWRLTAPLRALCRRTRRS